jgi:hypothetical protein
MVIEIFELTHQVGKWPGGYTNCLPLLQLEVELDIPF